MFWLVAIPLLAAQLAAAQSLSGVVDVHMHADPDSMARSIDGISLARLARERGLRAIVVKNHYESTAGLAWLARQAAPGLEVFGGIALNRAVGGINPAAVEQMTRVKGGFGRIVWMPTFDAEHAVRSARQQRPFVPVAREGKLLPAVLEVLDLVARNKLVLATGHSSPAECLLLIREAKARGIAQIVATHPMGTLNVAEMREAARLGAWIEFTCNTAIGTSASVPMRDFAAAIRAAGVEHAVLASDFGQAGNPLHPDGLLEMFRLLREQGFSPAEIERLSKQNPARLLSLP
ncbi:MAG: hypothetical protein HY822_19745 [Acidobacteria bacterium]|nr:hypothetical protein [Acidobacteriota bacterium]